MLLAVVPIYGLLAILVNFSLLNEYAVFPIGFLCFFFVLTGIHFASRKEVSARKLWLQEAINIKRATGVGLLTVPL